MSQNSEDTSGLPRAAIYARYSSDRQRDTSIDDQIRNCVQQAERADVRVGMTYSDRAISGAITARPQYQEMLRHAESKAFDVLMVDDLSRLSRDEYEMKGVLRKLQWWGIRIIGVSDGYDSTRKGHKLQAGFKGLVNEIFLDDLRERTHRGMTGQALKGYNCGGRTYGYRNVPIEEPLRKDAYGRPAISAVRYEVDDAQAEVVRRIHSWYADGHSYRWIAAELNKQGIRASRGRTWASSGVKVILENQMYEGRLVWNRRAWIKHPETGKRTYRERPETEWIITENRQLRIVPSEIVAEVRRRQKDRSHATGSAPARRFLFSGLMTCAQCGSNFVIVGNDRYGCASYNTRGPSVCGNGMSVSRGIVERTLLRSIKGRLLNPEHFRTFKRAAASILRSQHAHSNRESLAQQLQVAERTQQNLLTAIKAGILTDSTKDAMHAADAEVAGLKQRITANARSPDTTLPQAAKRYRQAVADLEVRLNGHVEPAREILRTLLGDTIRIHVRGEHLEAELADHVPALLAMSLKQNVDLAGCGGAMRCKSTFVPLVSS